MNQEKRLEGIIAALRKSGSLSPSVFVEQFHVSEETVRKDLCILERQGLVARRYGRVELLDTYVTPLRYRGLPELKTQIARQAVAEVPDGAVVFLDAGSTCAAAVEWLNLRQDLTIVTINVAAFQLLDAEANAVFLTGGRKRPADQAVTGSWTEQALGSIHAGILLLGTDGVRGAAGPTCRVWEEVTQKRLMIANAERVVALADSSKWHRCGPFAVCSWDDVDVLVTDQIPQNMPDNLEVLQV